MTTEEMWALRELLGMDVVLVPIPARQKGPRIKNWPKLTAEDMDRETYLQALVDHSNTGVLQGRNSGGLCSIDIDIDEEVERFLDYNPSLANTLQTRGERGANLWVRAGLNAPPLTHYYLRGEPWGEWRGDGGLTVISGIHLCGERYRFLKRVHPIQIDFAEIRWPEGVSPVKQPSPLKGSPAPFGEAGESGVSPLAASSESLYDSAGSIPSTSSTSLHDTGGSIALAIEAARAKQEFVAQYPHLEPYYERWIGRIHQPKAGARNDALVAFLTFLAHCVAPDIAILLALQFYERNRPMWKDSREQHRYEAINHLNHVLAHYPETLQADEANLYVRLDAPTQTTFRIGRDLASAQVEKTGEPTFFLSCQDLGYRTNLNPRQADRILKHLEALRVIEVVKKGAAHRKGKRGTATTYRWQLSLKARDPETPAALHHSQPGAD